MEKIKKHGISCLVKLFFCYILYGLMFNEFLVNKQDGIWNGTYFSAGNWELSLGILGQIALRNFCASILKRCYFGVFYIWNMPSYRFV